MLLRAKVTHGKATCQARRECLGRGAVKVSVQLVPPTLDGGEACPRRRVAERLGMREHNVFTAHGRPRPVGVDDDRRCNRLSVATQPPGRLHKGQQMARREEQRPHHVGNVRSRRYGGRGDDNDHPDARLPCRIGHSSSDIDMRPAAVTATGRVTIIAVATTPFKSTGGHDSVKRNTQGARVVNARQGLLFTAASHGVLCPGGVAIIGRALGMELEDDDVV